MANGFIFKFKQILLERGVKTEETTRLYADYKHREIDLHKFKQKLLEVGEWTEHNYTSPIYPDIEQAKAEGRAYSNNKKKIDWASGTDWEFSELDFFQTANGVEAKVWGSSHGLVGTTLPEFQHIVNNN